MSGTMRTHRMNATDKECYVDDKVALATNEVYQYSPDEIRQINLIMEAHAHNVSNSLTVNESITLMRGDPNFADPIGKVDKLDPNRIGLVRRLTISKSAEDEYAELVRQTNAMGEEQRTKGVL